VSKSIRDWLAEGEGLYETALAEYRELEQQLQNIEASMAAKREELSQLAQVIGKSAPERSRRVTAEVVETPLPPMGKMTSQLTGRMSR